MNKTHKEFDTYDSVRAKAISVFNQKFEKSFNYIQTIVLLARQCRCRLGKTANLVKTTIILISN